jgi:5-methylcytosine-specific restriction endonuclease McrA
MKSRICGRCGKVVSGQCDCKAVRHTNSCKDGYGRKWQRFVKTLYQKRVREGKGLCAMCGLAFVSTPHGDHIEPVTSADDPLFYKESNIQFLHPGCHGEKTKQDVRKGLTR